MPQSSQISSIVSLHVSVSVGIALIDSMVRLNAADAVSGEASSDVASANFASVGLL